MQETEEEKPEYLKTRELVWKECGFVSLVAILLLSPAECGAGLTVFLKLFFSQNLVKYREDNRI